MTSRAPKKDNFLKASKPEIEKIVLSRELGCCVHSILHVMLKDEQEHKHAKFGSTYLKYRKIVIEWMIDVCDYFALHATTTHAAIAYLDRLQPNEKYSRFEWQMLAICCILISAKYNESEEDVPDLATLEEITRQQISNDGVLNYELWALQRIGWTLSARTAMAFLSSYAAAGVVFRTDRIYGMPLDTYGFDARVIDKSFTSLTAMCIVDESFKSILCSKLASAILLYTRRQLKILPDWCPELVRLTTYESADLQSIVRKLMIACDDVDTVSIIECTKAAENLSLEQTGPDVVSSDEYASPASKSLPEHNKENTLTSSWDSPVSIIGFGTLPSCV
mmetsp:Transcript_3997/g.4083  ORF Transcript_3997/g.4083 Transcript_3997/m.4083 type:complete len:335 (+) Transcript_3997:104-1108(+)